jgi:choline dehydrogenase-like flavoprotein
MIVRGSEITNPLRESADVCIIGSGCGGGASAKILAEAGKKVIVLEEGPYVTVSEFDGTEETAYLNLYQQRAGQATTDLAVTVLQGRCIGGSSTVNWTTSLRPPAYVLETWRRQFHVEGLLAGDLEPYFDRIERYLNVHAEPESAHSPNNRIILDGGRKLGHRVQSTGRNTKDCVRAGACGLGCPFGAKRSVDVTYLADAVKAGAMVYADCRVESIRLEAGTKRVVGTILDQQKRTPRVDVLIEAPVVIVSASAINSPVILLKSKLVGPGGETGRNLTFHLTTAVMGQYDRVIYGAGGIPQSAMCDEFLNRRGDGGGFWIESVPIYPALAALALPAFGAFHRTMMQQFAHIGATIVLVKDSDSSGRVRVNTRGQATISYRWGDKDLRSLKDGVKEAARIHFAAGARRVFTLHTTPCEMTREIEIEERLAAASWGSNQIARYSAHPLGTCRMGSDPAVSVVDSHCQLHGQRGIFVIDGSVISTSLGVNPQLTILALAEKSTEWVVENFSRIHS